MGRNEYSHLVNTGISADPFERERGPALRVHTSVNLIWDASSRQGQPGVHRA